MNSCLLMCTKCPASISHYSQYTLQSTSHSFRCCIRRMGMDKLPRTVHHSARILLHNSCIEFPIRMQNNCPDKVCILHPYCSILPRILSIGSGRLRSRLYIPANTPHSRFLRWAKRSLTGRRNKQLPNCIRRRMNRMLHTLHSPHKIPSYIRCSHPRRKSSSPMDKDSMSMKLVRSHQSNSSKQPVWSRRFCSSLNRRGIPRLKGHKCMHMMYNCCLMNNQCTPQDIKQFDFNFQKKCILKLYRQRLNNFWHRVYNYSHMTSIKFNFGNRFSTGKHNFHE